MNGRYQRVALPGGTLERDLVLEEAIVLHGTAVESDGAPAGGRVTAVT